LSAVNETLESVRHLVATGDVRISEHGHDELSEDNISVRDVLSGIKNAVLVEDYPSYPKGPAVLVLQVDSSNRPVHVTAYRPDPARWKEDFTERRQ
jgi:hypothetical protein